MENWEHPTIALTMVVRNEEHCVERWVNSWKDVVDYYVIIDTGSTDKTLKIMTDLLKDYPGEIYQDEWVSHGINRNKAYDLLYKIDHIDYVLMIDADETLHVKPGWKQEIINGGNHDNFRLLMNDLIYVPRLYLNKSHLNWNTKWRWHAGFGSSKPIHNTYSHLTKMSFMHHNDSATWQAGSIKKYFNHAIDSIEDAQKLDEPQQRLQYYTGVAFYDSGQYELACKTFEKRIGMGGWQEEVYYSMLYIARILNAPSSFIRAIEHSPNRGEAIIELIKLYRALGQTQFALYWAEKGLNLTTTDEYKLHYNPKIIEEDIPKLYEEIKAEFKPLHIHENNTNSVNDIGMYLGHG